MLQTDQLPGRTVTVEGREYLYGSGTSYLGMARNEAFQAHLLEGMQRYGTNYSSSRLSNVQLRVYEEAEASLAQYTGAGAALTMSSGYLTGQMVVQYLRGIGRFIYAPGTHPAVWLDTNPSVEADYETWVSRLLTGLTDAPKEDLVIVCNSLDPLLARRYDFQWLSQLPGDRNITLVVDDSHGFGIIGREGAGVFTEFSPPSHVRLVVVSSFGKAFGIPGGVILSDRPIIEQLKASPFFGASSPVIPAYLFAFLQSEAIYRQARTRLFENIRRLSGQLPPGLFQTFTDYPVFYTLANELYSYLKERDVLISSFPYPSPEDGCITRVVINSLHTTADIDRMAAFINEFTL